MSEQTNGAIIDGGGEWTPARLIAVFCREELRSGFRRAGRREQERCHWHAGFCAYMGKDAYAARVDGFDDGHALWGAVIACGWSLIQDPGDRQFPYTFYLQWRPRERLRLEAAFEHAGGRGVELAARLDQLRESPDGAWCMASYSEGDFGVAVYDDEDAYRAAERKVRAF